MGAAECERAAPGGALRVKPGVIAQRYLSAIEAAGHGIVLMPPAYNHPARVAERISTLDLISNGRVEFGTGETSADAELFAFHVAREEKQYG